VAGRPWTFLEAESLRDPRRYSLFSGPPKGLSEERTLPTIAAFALTGVSVVMLPGETNAPAG